MTDFYAEAFGLLKSQFKNKIPSWLASRRGEGMERFLASGFPSTREEEWKYTNLRPLSQESFVLSGEGDAKNLSSNQFLASCVAGAHAFRNVSINGRHSDQFSTDENLPKGCLFSNLRQAMDLYPDLLEQHLGKVWPNETHSLVDLNMAFHNDGAFLYLPENVALEHPIHFLYISLRNGRPVMSSPRNLVIAEKGSRATIIETYMGFGSGGYFTNAVTEIVAKEKAQIDHYKFQNELQDATHTGTILSEQEENSRVLTHSISLGGKLVRNDIKMRMNGSHSHSSLNGLFIGTGKQHIDHHTTVDHAVPFCSSQQIYKGVLDENAHGVFDGQVLVRPDAQKSDAQQMNKNLLLSEEAIIDTTPRLEIYADDVKCSHGATIGALSEEAIFYLRSRGLNRSEARNLLTFAFANEMVERVKVEKLRTYLECYLLTHFADGHLRSQQG